MIPENVVRKVEPRSGDLLFAPHVGPRGKLVRLVDAGQAIVRATASGSLSVERSRSFVVTVGGGGAFFAEPDEVAGWSVVRRPPKFGDDLWHGTGRTIEVRTEMSPERVREDVLGIGGLGLNGKGWRHVDGFGTEVDWYWDARAFRPEEIREGDVLVDAETLSREVVFHHFNGDWSCFFSAEQPEMTYRTSDHLLARRGPFRIRPASLGMPGDVLSVTESGEVGWSSPRCSEEEDLARRIFDTDPIVLVEVRRRGEVLPCPVHGDDFDAAATPGPAFVACWACSGRRGRLGRALEIAWQADLFGKRTECEGRAKAMRRGWLR